MSETLRPNPNPEKIPEQKREKRTPKFDEIFSSAVDGLLAPYINLMDQKLLEQSALLEEFWELRNELSITDDELPLFMLYVNYYLSVIYEGKTHQMNPDKLIFRKISQRIKKEIDSMKSELIAGGLVENERAFDLRRAANYLTIHFTQRPDTVDKAIENLKRSLNN